MTNDKEAPREPDPGSMNGDVHGSPDATLGGYFREHSRPPAFEGSDGEPYTVSPEAERTADLRAPWDGYLVFPRWAHTGLGVVGHVETDTLLRGRSRDDVLRALGELPLVHVRELLDRALDRADDGGEDLALDPADDLAPDPADDPLGPGGA
jgi:hypothetical protein